MTMPHPHNPSPDRRAAVRAALNKLSDSSASRGWLDCKAGAENVHPRSDLVKNAETELQQLIDAKCLAVMDKVVSEVIGHDENRIHARDVPKHGIYWESKELAEDVLPERDKIMRNKFRNEQRAAIEAIKSEIRGKS